VAACKIEVILGGRNQKWDQGEEEERTCVPEPIKKKAKRFLGKWKEMGGVGNKEKLRTVEQRWQKKGKYLQLKDSPEAPGAERSKEVCRGGRKFIKKSGENGGDRRSLVRVQVLRSL